MLVQSKPILSQEILITGVSPEKFIFNEFFQMGDHKTTNLSHRCADFYDSFQENSHHQCEVPDRIRFVGVPDAKPGTIKGFLKEAQILKEFWGLRVPIKLVGHMKNMQKNGEEGHLSVSGSSNVFLCRDSGNSLHLVTLKFRPRKVEEPSSNSWTISSKFFDPDEVLCEPLRLFVASR